MSQFKRVFCKSTFAMGAMILLCATQQLACAISPSDEEATADEEAATATQLDPEGIRVAKDLRALSAALDRPVHSFERPAGTVQQHLAASPESRAILGIDTWRIYRVPLQSSSAELVDVEGFTKAGHEPLVALRTSTDPSQNDTAFRFDGQEYKLTAYPNASWPPAIRAMQALWGFEARKGASGVTAPATATATATASASASPWCAVYVAKFHASVYGAIGTCAAAAAEDFLNPVADASCLYSLYSIGTDSDNIIKYCGRNPPALPSVLILPGSYKKTCNLSTYRYHASAGKVQMESSCQRNWPRRDYINSRTTLTVRCLPLYGDIANCDGQLKCGKCN
jgi:hypothetical protein